MAAFEGWREANQPGGPEAPTEREFEDAVARHMSPDQEA